MSDNSNNNNNDVETSIHPVRKMIVDTMLGDDILSALHSEYEDQPAIFAMVPAPENAEYPYSVIGSFTSNTHRDTKTSRGRIIDVDIHSYAAAGGNPNVVDTIAQRVQKLFHKPEDGLEVDGNLVLLSLVEGPYNLTREPSTDVYHFVNAVQLWLESEEEEEEPEQGD